MGSHQLLHPQGSFSPGCSDESPGKGGTVCLCPGQAGLQFLSSRSPQHQLPSQGLLSSWHAVSHVSDVTSPRHWSLEMDLMSPCFLQLRKTSKRLMLEHPEEPAGLSAAATVPTGGQIAAQCSKAGRSAPKAERQTCRGQRITEMGGCLSTMRPSTLPPSSWDVEVMPCNASRCSGGGGSAVVAPCPHSEDPAASLRAATQ